MRRELILSALVFVCLSRVSFADTDLPAKLTDRAFAADGKSLGTVLLTVNWGRRWGCGSYENAQLQEMTFRRLPGDSGDSSADKLKLEGPATLLAMDRWESYAFLVRPGEYAISSYEVRQAASPSNVEHIVGDPKVLIVDGKAVGGSFAVGVGEIVYIGDFTVNCAQHQSPWRYFLRTPETFASMAKEFHDRFQSTAATPIVIRLFATQYFGSDDAQTAATAASATTALTFKQLTERAEAGDAEAQYTLAVTYDTGAGVGRSVKAAEKWYRLAAAAGNADAQNAVGSILQERRKYAEAMTWYAQAAAQNHPRGTHNMAYLYDEALGVAQDRPKARELYVKAAKQGFAESMVNLAVNHNFGQGVPVDRLQACIWSVRALSYAQEGDDRVRQFAQRILDSAAIHMTDDEMTKCKEAAAEWQLEGVPGMALPSASEAPAALPPAQ